MQRASSLRPGAMMPAHNSADENATHSEDAPATTVAPLPKPTRDWLRLAAAHLRIIAISPALAATLFAVLSPDRKSLLHWGGILALLVTILCSYLLFGVFAFLSVLLVSPFLWLISKIPGSTTGLLLALVLGGAATWLICGVVAKDIPAFQYAATATAALGSAALEKSWRKTRLRADSQHPKTPETFP